MLVEMRSIGLRCGGFSTGKRIRRSALSISPAIPPQLTICKVYGLILPFAIGHFELTRFDRHVTKWSLAFKTVVGVAHVTRGEMMIDRGQAVLLDHGQGQCLDRLHHIGTLTQGDTTTDQDQAVLLDHGQDQHLDLPHVALIAHEAALRAEEQMKDVDAVEEALGGKRKEEMTIGAMARTKERYREDIVSRRESVQDHHFVTGGDRVM